MGCSCSRNKIILLFLFILASASATSSQNTKCPFSYVYEFGDGTTDIGNSIKIRPFGASLPPTRLPYGITFPGTPTGRWSDGFVDIDFVDYGLQLAPYLSLNATRRTTTNGIMFSVARRPVLDFSFFTSRGVRIPSFVVPLSGQLRWFKDYLRSICSKQTDCTSRLGDSLVLVDDIESNDIGYALSQGKSIQQVQSYLPFIIRAIVNAATELIKMGGTRIVISGSAPLGCYPYILTALPNNDPTAYDDLGCLKSVNDLVILKNKNLHEAVNNLSMEFPHASIIYGEYYEAVQTVIRQAPITGNTSLGACCGIGGKYNYDSKRFCASPGVPVCSNPKQYVYWDGLHFTQEAYKRILQILLPPYLKALNCTS